MLCASMLWYLEFWGAVEACEPPGEGGESATCGHCGRWSLVGLQWIKESSLA